MAEKKPKTVTLTHLDAQGQAHMVDVGSKAETSRQARASGEVRMSPEAFDQVAHGESRKGDVLAVARVAGIQAAKRTDEWIPLCHTVALTSIELEFVLNAQRSSVEIVATSQAVGRTGVEMESLVAVSAAALTIYDMVKSVDRATSIGEIFLLYKSGGKRGTWQRTDETERDK